jgi:predicted regulator of Ras-like GTPase activity (Roadblock/LC7/MglB family)
LESDVLKSLFGELVPAPLKPGGPMPEFAATAVLESTDTRVDDDGRMVDRQQQDLFVSGSPAAAMREHLAQARHSDDVRTITLLDPTRLWAPGVIKALSDATGQPVERLHLRAQATLTTLATLERTVVPRRGDASLKIYHADLRVAEGENLAIPFVLMERSQMAAVIVGPMVPGEVEAMLMALQRAALEPTWKCESLLFLLPPATRWIAERIAALDWPGQLHVEVIDEPLTGTSSVWNALLAAWDRQQTPAAPLATDPAAVDARNVARQLRTLMATDGVLGAALADATDGDLLAGESRDNSVDLKRAAAALAPLLRAHRKAHDEMGLVGSLEEFSVAAGTAHHLVRPLARRPHQFLFARIERQHANLALLRFKLAEAERSLG